MSFKSLIQIIILLIISIILGSVYFKYFSKNNIKVEQTAEETIEKNEELNNDLEQRIANLEKDLAMALKAESVRIIAPVPGKGCVGIEVPNDKPAAVCLKEILESKAWADANAEIPIVLGKEASGIPLVADLTKMPHLLVAGSTGSGKTVCINTIIAWC